MDRGCWTCTEAAPTRRSEWKQARFNEKWYAGETVSVSIGQGSVAVTPVSMAVYISTLANGGTGDVEAAVKEAESRLVAIFSRP